MRNGKENRMGLFDRKKQETEVRDTTPAPISPPVDDVLLRALLDGETITREKALTIPYVAGAVDYISNTIASMPIKLYKVRDGKVEEVEKDTRVKLLNGDTGDTLDAFQMKKAMVTDYLMGKGGYCYIKKYRNEVTGLYYVEDMYIGILRTPEPIYKDYQIMVMGKAYKPFEFIKLLRNTKDGASGTGLTVEIGKELETAYQTLLYQLGMVKAGGNKRGFLQASRKLGQDEINILKNAWRNLYGNNSENIVVLNNGVEFKEASNSSVEMQMNESKKTLRDEINDLFHIYPNDFDRTYKEAIYPIVKAFETALDRDLLLEKEKKNHFFELDVKEILRVSIKERYESYKLAKETGFMTLNEIRRAENMDFIEGLDVINVGLGAVLYDTNRHVYYTPNTDKIGDISDGSSNDTEDTSDVSMTDEEIDKMLEGHELAEEYDESGNSAVRYNENHDAKTGRFAPSNGAGGGWDNKVGQMRSEFDALSDNKKAVYLWKNGYLSKEESLQHMKDGNISEYGDQYFQILRENGDFTPEGETRDNSNRAREMTESGEYGWTEARTELIKRDTGFSDAEVAQTQQELNTWFSNRWDRADTETLDRYVEASPTYDGVIHRGLHFDEDGADAVQQFANLQAGDRINMRDKNSSWTSSEETARGYAHTGDSNVSSVVITSLKNRTSSPVADLSTQGEYEVLASSKAQWTVLRTDVTDLPNGNKKVQVYVVEAGENGTGK